MRDIDFLSALLKELDSDSILEGVNLSSCKASQFNAVIAKIISELRLDYGVSIPKRFISGQTIQKWFSDGEIPKNSAHIELLAAVYLFKVDNLDKTALLKLISEEESKRNKRPQKYWPQFQSTHKERNHGNIALDYFSRSDSIVSMITRSFVEKHLNKNGFEFMGLYHLYRFSTTERNKVYKYPVIIDTSGNIFLKDESDTVLYIYSGISMKIDKRLLLLFDKKIDTSESDIYKDTFQCVLFSPGGDSFRSPAKVKVLQGISIRRARTERSIASRDLMIRVEHIKPSDLKLKESKSLIDQKLKKCFAQMQFTELWLQNHRVPDDLKNYIRKNYTDLEKSEKQIVDYVSKGSFLAAERAELSFEEISKKVSKR